MINSKHIIVVIIFSAGMEVVMSQCLNISMHEDSENIEKDIRLLVTSYQKDSFN